MHGEELVLGGHIVEGRLMKPLTDEQREIIERQVNMWDAERNNAPKMDSLKYWAETSIKYPLVAEIARHALCVPASSSSLERSFSKAGHIMRARRARLTDDHMAHLSFLSWNQDLV